MSRPRSQPFVKGHGTENDFVLLPDPDGDLELSAGLVAALCDRRAGVGGDGVLRVVRTAAVPEAAHLAGEAEWFMDYRNADGSLAEMCGNGVRVYARYLVDAGLAPAGSLALATRAGVRGVELGATGPVTVEMGAARPDREPTVVGLGGRRLTATAVDVGNPHAVAVVDDPVAGWDLTGDLSLDPQRFPDGANVELVNLLAGDHLVMRVRERGVGETRSCGTGACAAAAAAGHGRTWRVDVPGGRLSVGWRGDRVLLTGPAVLVAAGEFEPGWWAAAG